MAGERRIPDTNAFDFLMGAAMSVFCGGSIVEHDYWFTGILAYLAASYLARSMRYRRRSEESQ